MEKKKNIACCANDFLFLFIPFVYRYFCIITCRNKNILWFHFPFTVESKSDLRHMGGQKLWSRKREEMHQIHNLTIKKNLLKMRPALLKANHRPEKQRRGKTGLLKFCDDISWSGKIQNSSFSPRKTPKSIKRKGRGK